MLFFRRVHSPDRPPLDSNPLPTDYETRAPTNAPPETGEAKELHEVMKEALIRKKDAQCRCVAIILRWLIAHLQAFGINRQKYF